MDSLKKLRKPGRSVFFQDQEYDPLQSSVDPSWYIKDDSASVPKAKKDLTTGTDPLQSGVDESWYIKDDSASKDISKGGKDLVADTEAQLQLLLNALKSLKRGDFSIRLPMTTSGIMGEIVEAFNDVVAFNEKMTNEVRRVLREVGTVGKLGDEALVKEATGTLKDPADNVNAMVGTLTSQVRNITDVATAVSNDDLSRKITVEVKGEIIHYHNR